MYEDVRIITIQPGAPPTCTIGVHGKVYPGIRMVMGNDGWKPYLLDLLDTIEQAENA